MRSVQPGQVNIEDDRQAAEHEYLGVDAAPGHILRIHIASLATRSGKIIAPWEGLLGMTPAGANASLAAPRRARADSPPCGVMKACAATPKKPTRISVASRQKLRSPWLR